MMKRQMLDMLVLDRPMMLDMLVMISVMEEQMLTMTVMMEDQMLTIPVMSVMMCLMAVPYGKTFRKAASLHWRWPGDVSIARLCLASTHISFTAGPIAKAAK